MEEPTLANLLAMAIYRHGRPTVEEIEAAQAAKDGILRHTVSIRVGCLDLQELLVFLGPIEALSLTSALAESEDYGRQRLEAFRSVAVDHVLNEMWALAEGGSTRPP